MHSIRVTIVWRNLTLLSTWCDSINLLQTTLSNDVCLMMSDVCGVQCEEFCCFVRTVNKLGQNFIGNNETKFITRTKIYLNGV